MPHRFFARLSLTFLLLFIAVPAQAAVTITFWSHELGNSFPHAFFTLRGVPDAGGPQVDINYGFTARSISPAMLMGSVRGRLDIAKPGYINGSNAQFSMVMTDAQYANVLALVADWGETGDSHYNLNDRNCISFVKEAARRMGLTDLDRPALMKKPRSYLQSIGTANTAHVMLIDVKGKAYLTALPPIVTPPGTARSIVIAMLPAPIPAAP